MPQVTRPELTQIWARQLLKEHELLCRRYGLQLSRPVIEIVDVASYWGKWLAGTTTISLSQTLLDSQPWDAVLNVLKHEMAHQLVAEVYGGKPGHGADFKRACESLGLPARFRRASSTIAGKVPGEPDHRATETERILQKIHKLLALTDSSNEHEALLAMQKARQLLDRYNLADELKQHQDGADYGNLLINLKRKRLECYHRAICALLIEYFHAKIVITPLYDAQDLTTYRCIDIMGRDSNIKIAGYVYHFLMDRLPVLWHKHRANNRGVKNGRNSYWLGVVNGFREGLANDLPTREKEPENAAARKAMPTTINNDPDLARFIASRYPKLQNSRNRTTRVDQHHFEAGQKAGRLLQFRPGLAGAAEPLLG